MYPVVLFFFEGMGKCSWNRPVEEFAFTHSFLSSQTCVSQYSFLYDFAVVFYFMSNWITMTDKGRYKMSCRWGRCVHKYHQTWLNKLHLQIFEQTKTKLMNLIMHVLFIFIVMKTIQWSSSYTSYIILLILLHMHMHIKPMKWQNVCYNLLFYTEKYLWST